MKDKKVFEFEGQRLHVTIDWETGSVEYGFSKVDDNGNRLAQADIDAIQKVIQEDLNELAKRLTNKFDEDIKKLNIELKTLNSRLPN